MTQITNAYNITYTLKKERTGLMSRVARFFAGMFETRQDPLYSLPPHIAARLYL